MAPMGYQVGTAWVQVLPSFDTFQKRTAAWLSSLSDLTIDLQPVMSASDVQQEVASAVNGTTATVDVNPHVDTKAIDKELSTIKPPTMTVTPKVDSKAATQELAKLGESTVVTVSPDTSNLDAKLRELESRRTVAVIAIDADLAKTRARIDELNRAKLHKDIDVDADITEYKEQIKSLLEERESSTVDVKLEVVRANVEIERLRKALVFKRVQIDANIEKAKARIKSLRKAAEEDATLDIKADVTYAELQIEHLVAQKRAVTVEMSAKTEVVRARLRAVENGKYRTVVEVDADLTEARAKLAELQALKPHLDVDVDAELTAAEARIDYLTAKREVVEIQADLDIARAKTKLEELNNGLSRLRNNQTDINMEASDASRAISIVGALTAAIAVLGYAAPAAAAAVALIPAAILGAAQGFAAVAIGFRGIGEASDAMQAVEDEAASRSGANSAARIAATKRIASAESALRQALEGADRSAIRSAQQVTQAREGVAEAQADAVRRVQGAERSLESAQVSALDAQLALTRARKDAAEQAEDLRISVAGAALDEEAAVLAVQRAQERLTAARNAGATGRDLQEVDLSARQAAQSLVEVRERYGDLREEAAEASQQGVAGNAQVASAQRQVEESTQRVHDAEQGLADARADSTRQVAKAQERLVQAQQQASWAATDASHAVAEAQRALAEATVATGAAGSAAMDKLTLAMGKLGPAGQDFAEFLHNVGKPALEELGSAAAETMLPKVQAAFATLLTLMPEVKAALADTGNVIGDLAIKGADMVTSGPWRADFLTIASRNTRMLSIMGDAGLSLLNSFRSLTVASGPLAEGIAASAEASVNQFNAWIQGKRESGELSVWFNEMGIRAGELWEVLTQLAGGVFDVVGALAPLGRVILEIVGPLAEMIGKFAEANPTLVTVIGLAVLLGSTFVSFFRTIGGLTQAVRTSKGVFDSLAFGMRGTQEATTKATDAAGRHTAATGKMSGAIERGSGVVGKISTGLHNVSAAYTVGAGRAGAWATRTSAAVGAVSQAVTTRLVPAVTGGVNQVDSFLPATQRAEGGFQRLSTAASTTMGAVARSVGGAASAVTKGLGGALMSLWSAFGLVGLAITAATIGLGFLASMQAEAAQEAAAHKAQIQSLTDALTESGGAIDDNVRKQIRLGLEEKSVADNARHLGLNVGTMIRAIAEGGTVASGFEADLYGVGMEMVKGKGLGTVYTETLDEVIKKMLAGGGQASDYSAEIHMIAREYEFVTGASAEASAEFENQLVELLDLAGGYRGASGDFKTAEQEQKEIADAQGDAATETERHTSALKALNDAVLGSVDKDLAHRQAINALAEAQARTAEVTADATSTTSELTAARLAEEQAALRVITTAGELAYANSTASTESGKQREALLAQAEAAANLANGYGGPLPASLQTYLDKLHIAQTDTGEWVVMLENIPTEALTTAVFDDTIARDKLLAWSNLNPSKDYPGPLPSGGGALGAIAIPAYAMGGMRSMSARHAQMVPPRTPRLIGDRMRGDEAFIPINTEPRSVGILADAAHRMGFALMPLFAGAILGMAGGGLNQAATSAAGGADGAALTLAPVALADFTVAVQQMIAMALVPLANEVNGTTVPALTSFEDHAGTESVNAINALAALLPPLHAAFAVTAAAIVASWASVTRASQGSVSAISGQLSTLRQSVQSTGMVFSSTSDWIGTTWARITNYTADPVRAALAGPYNSGLIPAWNYLSTFFNLNRPLKPMAIPFASGGKVPGVGNQDTVPALLTPGEYVVPKPVVKKWGVNNLRAAHMATLRGGFSGLEGMLADDPLYRVGFASGGPVPEALARAIQFGQRMHGKPYVWGGSSEAGTDCSGWMAMLARALVDEKPYARREWATGQTAGGRPPPRFAGGIEGLFAIGVNPGSHTAGTLAGRNVESGGAHNFVAFGPPSKGADHSSFPLKFHLPEIGGQFVSGGAGGGFDLSTFIRDAFNATYQQVGAYQNAWGGNMMAQAGAALTSQAADAIMSQAVNTISPMGTSGNVESWRPLVLQALKMLGLPEGWADITLRRMNQESGGNPRAVNNWDSNAARGDPSKGLMQVIGSTFRAYQDSRAPDDVFDPLANILASAKYAMSRYGSLPAAYGRAGGYDDGGYLPLGYNTVYNGLSRPEAVLTDNQWNALITMATSSSSGGEFRGNLYLSSGEFMGVVQGEIDRAQGESGRALARRIR